MKARGYGDGDYDVVCLHKGTVHGHSCGRNPLVNAPGNGDMPHQVSAGNTVRLHPAMPGRMERVMHHNQSQLVVRGGMPPEDHIQHFHGPHYHFWIFCVDVHDYQRPDQSQNELQQRVVLSGVQPLVILQNLERNLRHDHHHL